jgi:Protein of unknown function (DUF3891)
VEAYLKRERALQAELRASLGADPVEVDRIRELIFFWDWLSLALCLDWAPASSPELPGAGRVRLEPAGDGALTLDPWPFAEPMLRLHTEGRRLPGLFQSETDLHAALASAPWTALEWRLVAPSGD